MPKAVASKGKRFPRRRTSRLMRVKALVGFSFITPWLIGFLVLFAVPFISNIGFSLSTGASGTGLFQFQLTGLQNYFRAFFEDGTFWPDFLPVVRDTVVRLVLITVLSLYIAILLNRRLPGRGVFRVICFLPVMLGSGYVMSLLLGQNVDSASINAVKELLLPKEVIQYIGPGLTNAILFFLNQLTVVLWRSGVQIIIFLSALQSIPASLYEAAKVDAATEWESLWFITMPMLAPMILLNMVYTIVDSFNDDSNSFMTRLYSYAFEYGDRNYAAAMGLIYFVFVLLLIGLLFVCFKRAIDNVKA